MNYMNIIFTALGSGLFATIITLLVQKHAEIKRVKISVFETLMAHRYLISDKENVEALNKVEVVFYSDSDVRQAWKEFIDETEKVKVFLQSGDPVVVSLAPSFVANYEGVGINAMRDALQKLGFYEVEETAIGATIVKYEYERMLKEDERDIIITSCCHSINLLIQKYFPAELEYLADVVSPMQAHCMDIKKRF